MRNASWIHETPEAFMADKPFDFVDESEEPHAHGTVSRGRLTGWESVVFLVAEPEDDAMISPGATDETTP